MKTMLILGGDRVACSILASLAPSHDLMVVIDKSTSVKRVLRLVAKRKIGLLLLMKMITCELKRKRPHVSLSKLKTIKSNSDLLRIIDEVKPQRIILFRAGLVISGDVIAKGIPLMNIHCAKIPEYGGLGSIERAIRHKAVGQFATLHQVTTTIDQGDVLDVEPFFLDINKSYCHNENVAYRAGIRLLSRHIGFKGLVGG
jgi:methionyl-tRNA formyltransferase